MKTFYRIWINDTDDNPTRFSMEHPSKEHLQERGEEWVRMMFIKSFYITEHTEN